LNIGGAKPLEALPNKEGPNKPKMGGLGLGLDLSKAQ